MNRALVLLASALVLVSVLNLTCASSVETEDIAGKYIPVSRFGQPAKVSLLNTSKRKLTSLSSLAAKINLVQSQMRCNQVSCLTLYKVHSLLGHFVLNTARRMSDPLNQLNYLA